MDIYDAEKTYKHGETCSYEGIGYGASWSGKAMMGIAPVEDNIGTFWLVENKAYVEPSNVGLIDLE